MFLPFSGMKTVATTISLLLLGRVASAQSLPVAPAPEQALPLIEAQMEASTGKMRDNSLVTNKTFNHFAAKRQAYYLTGVANLSLFKNFAIADVTSGVLQVGQNITPQHEQDLISGVFTVAFQSNIANNLANLFAKNKLANDLGIPLSYTFFFGRPTQAGIDPPDKTELEKKRAFYYALLKKKTALESQMIGSTTVGGGNPTTIDEAERALAKEALLAKATNEFYDNELALFESQFPSFRTAWLRLQGFVPISSNTYQVAPASSLNFEQVNTRKWSAGANIGFIKENSWYWGAFFVNASARVARTNAVEQQNAGIKGYTQYNLLATQPQPNQLYYDGDGNKVYVGDLGEAWTVPLQLQVIYFFKSRGDNKVGVDIQMERYAVNYGKTNLLLGIPLFLKGKEDKGVNVEAQLRWRDTDKKVLGSDRFTVGLSVALPFGNTIK